MKKITLVARLIALLCFLQVSISCSDNSDSSASEDTSSSVPDWKCGTYNGKTLWTGPKGGCYYINSNGNKTYVDRSECKC